MLRVLFLGLYNKERKSPVLDQPDSATFYDKGLRPAIGKLIDSAISEWPPTYTAEMFRARGKNGTLAFQSKSVPKHFVPFIGEQLRDTLSENDVSWGEGLIFLHQIRGVKAANGHHPNSMSAHDALDDLFRDHHITAEAHIDGRWWVDVGLELGSLRDECLAWRTDSHFHVVKDVLDIPPLHARRITQTGSSKYIRDLTSHLTSVSGCRISPGVRAQGPHSALYLQMYMTDKSITYRPDGSHFGKFMRGQDILQGKADDYCHDLYTVYRDATTKNPSLARVEVRVPLADAANVLVDVDIDALRGGLVCFTKSIWW
jgi:hypothetical protein